MPGPPTPAEPLALAVVVVWEEHPLDTRVAVTLTEGSGGISGLTATNWGVTFTEAGLSKLIPWSAVVACTFA